MDFILILFMIFCQELTCYCYISLYTRITTQMCHTPTSIYGISCERLHIVCDLLRHVIKIHDSYEVSHLRDESRNKLPHSAFTQKIVVNEIEVTHLIVHAI